MEILQISIQARNSKRGELWRTCQAISKAALLGVGIKRSDLSHGKDNENLIYLKETWENPSYWDEHFRSDIFSALLGAMKLLGDSYEIRINGGTPEEGMDAVRRARGK